MDIRELLQKRASLVAEAERILADETNKTFSAWGDDEDIREAFAQYFKQKAEQ